MPIHVFRAGFLPAGRGSNVGARQACVSVHPLEL